MDDFKLYIIDNGDWSVGIPSSQYEIVCPFWKDEDEEIKEEFRKAAMELYKPYCEGRMVAVYDGEVDE